METTLLPQPNETANAYVSRLVVHFQNKANHNKAESLTCFILVIASTLALSPLVAFASDFVLGKVVPVTLSLLATGLGTWLQFRKPHQLWAVYRTAQRHLEFEAALHQFSVEPYADTASRDSILIKRTKQVALAAHDLWVPLVPSPEMLDRLSEESRKVVRLPDSTHEPKAQDASRRT